MSDTALGRALKIFLIIDLLILLLAGSYLIKIRKIGDFPPFYPEGFPENIPQFENHNWNNKLA